MIGYQDSKRGGSVIVELVVNNGESRVLLSGNCVTVLKSSIVVYHLLLYIQSTLYI